MLPAHLITLCWIIFLLYWMANARSVKTALETQSRSSRLAHRLPVWIGIILLFFVGHRHPGIVIIPHSLATACAGAATAALGIAIAIWARKTIASNWSGDIQFKQDHQLVQQGPYRFVRHPIYTGILLMCLGTAIESGRAAAFAGVAFFLLGFWIKLRQEERLMARHFPAEYPAYKARVKALIPYLL